MPPDQPDHSPVETPGQFEYFMLRVFLPERVSEVIAGQVERLGTGEKRRFESGGELLALVSRWPAITTDREGS